MYLVIINSGQNDQRIFEFELISQALAYQAQYGGRIFQEIKIRTHYSSENKDAIQSVS